MKNAGIITPARRTVVFRWQKIDFLTTVFQNSNDAVLLRKVSLSQINNPFTENQIFCIAKVMAKLLKDCTAESGAEFHSIRW